MYNNAYGLWEVTTEGDCEGKSTRKLGVYEGFIDDIAFALVGSCCYSLRFKPFSFNFYKEFFIFACIFQFDILY